VVDSPQFQSSVLNAPLSLGGALTLTDVSAWTKSIVRAAADTAAASQIDVGFGASRTAGEVLVCGQRPGEWMLLTASPAAVASLVDGLDRSGHVSIIDHTHSRALFRLTGPAASSVLEKICSLDWSDPMTPDGAVVSAAMAKVTCDITRNDTSDAPSYLIACDRSFGQYLFDAILDAAAEFQIE